MKRTRKFCSCFILLIASITFQACDSGDEVTPQSQWEKIEFADQGAIYSMYGSLEENLLLGTSHSILKLTERGKVNKEVLRVNEPIADIMLMNDTLYAVTNFTSYYSIDGGETWKGANKGFVPFNQRELRDTKGILYQHVALANGELITPSLILRSSDNGTNWENIFPYKHYVYSMYLDSKDRLYLGINGWEWDGISFSGKGNTAILYYWK